MKHVAAIAGVAALILGLVAIGWTQPAQGPHHGQGPHGQMQAQGPMQCGQMGAGPMLGRRGGMMGAGPGMGQGYIETGPEAKRIYDRITRLQTQMRQKVWELSALKTQGAGEEQIAKKQQEIRDLARELQTERQNLRQYVVRPEADQGMHRRGRQFGGGLQLGPEGRMRQGQGMHQQGNCPRAQ